MHSVSRVDEAAAQTPQLHGSHSTGFRRATYVDHRVGASGGEEKTASHG
jgi:hypothetical protein